MKYDLKKAFKDLVDGFMRYPIWTYQAYHLLVAKYKRTALGTLWVSGNFLIMSLSVAYVFGSIFGQPIKEFLPWCLMGNLVGSAVLWTVMEAPELYMGNASLIKNNATPFSYYLFESVAKLLFLFAHNFLVYYIVVILFGFAVIPRWEVIPGILVMTLVLLPWGSLIGMISARYRDLRFLLPNLSMFLFFITPIYWKPDMLGKRSLIAELNPLYHMISIIREPVLGHAPSMNDWLFSIGFAAFGAVLWLIFFPLYRRRIPFWV